MLIFSEQDVIKDPPFSKLDLISCRNLLIYMGGNLQKKLIPLFHYALNPGGFSSWAPPRPWASYDGPFSRWIESPSCISARRIIAARTRTRPGDLSSARGRRSMGHSRWPPGRRLSSGRLPLRELTEQALLQQFAPAGALVNDQGDILYLHGRTGMYLEPAPGEAGLTTS